jgi:phosphocarrier protein HPr
MKVFEIKIDNEHGLHARPAGQLVQLCSKFEGSVRVSKGDMSVDGKSLLGMLKLAVKKGEVLSLSIDQAGDEAKGEFETKVRDLVASGFNEV